MARAPPGGAMSASIRFTGVGMSKCVPSRSSIVRSWRSCIQSLKAASPSIIYFDEIEALIPKRTGSDATGVTDRVISQMLTEIDGINRLHDVIIIASTNRPDLVDEALLRPGRIDLKRYAWCRNSHAVLDRGYQG